MIPMVVAPGFVQRREETVERIVAGHPAAQREESAQPNQAHAGELLQAVETFAATEQRAEATDDFFDYVEKYYNRSRTFI